MRPPSVTVLEWDCGNISYRLSVFDSANGNGVSHASQIHSCAKERKSLNTMSEENVDEILKVSHRSLKLREGKGIQNSEEYTKIDHVCNHKRVKPNMLGWLIRDGIELHNYNALEYPRL